MAVGHTKVPYIHTVEEYERMKLRDDNGDSNNDDDDNDDDSSSSTSNTSRSNVKMQNTEHSVWTQTVDSRIREFN